MTPLSDIRAAIVGGGNIGRILVERLLAAGVARDQLAVCDADLARAEGLAAHFGIRSVDLDHEALIDAELLLLATPPKGTLDVLRAVASRLRGGQTVVSFAAALPLRSLEPLIPPGVSIVRVMPNAPSLVGEGMNLVVYGTSVSPEARSLVEKLLNALGESLEVRDEQMNWAVGLSGASMRSLLPVLEGMTQAGIDAGLQPETSRNVAAQVMLGTAALAAQTDLSFEQLKALTPMQTVDEALVARIFREAARAAKDKTDEVERRLLSWAAGPAA